MKKILVVDDHPILREGLESVLKVDPDLKICGDAGTVREALVKVETTKPDLVLTDLSLPDRNGLELIKDLKTLHPDLPILVVSMHDENIYASRALRAGAQGYLMKEIALDRIAEAIHKVLAGDIYISEAIANRFLRTLVRGGRQSAASTLERLSDRELEVFELIGFGSSTVEIAERLKISPRTVNAHRSHIREKLELRDSGAVRVEATKWIEARNSYE